MSNTANVVNGIYAEIVEIKKKQLELMFMPVTNRAKNHASLVRDLRSRLANLQRDIAAARKGKEVVAREVKVKAPAKKRSK